MSARPAVAPWLLVMAVLCFLSSGVSRAATLRRGEDITVGPQEVINDDLYAFGRNIRIQGTVRGDVVAFGRIVEVSGPVDGDVFAAASDTRVSGPVSGSVRAAGDVLVLNGPVGRDALLAARDVQLRDGARVQGDAFLAGNALQVQAPVGGELRASAKTLVLDAPVQGDVRAEVRTLRLTPAAHLGGSLSYRSEKQAQMEPGAMVVGPVKHEGVERHPGVGVAMLLVGWMRSLVGLFVLGLLLVFASPSLARRAPATLREVPWASLGWGALLFLCAPVAAAFVFLLGLMLGGWWIGVFLLGLFLLAVALCFPVVGLVIGRWLLERSGRTGPRLAFTLLLGLALLTAVTRVPFLGHLVWLATVFFGLGALALAVVRGRRPGPGPQVAA